MTDIADDLKIARELNALQADQLRTLRGQVDEWKTRAVNCEADLPDRVNAELEPIFLVQVDLDGDDDAATQTANVRTLLDGALKEIEGFGAIRGYVLTVLP